MKSNILTFIFILQFIIACNGQNEDFQKEFQELCQTQDTLKQRQLLQKWNKKAPKDPELFTSYFNYYFTKSKQESLTLTTDQPEGESLSFQDQDGKTAGYIGSGKTIFLEKPLEKGFNKISKGIDLYPDRLDMRFGKIYALGLVKEWQKFTEEIIETIKYSSKNNNQWKWTNNINKENGKEFFLSSIQDYQLTLYNTQDDNLLKNMRQIAEEVLKHYPSHVESLSNLSITYLITEQFDKAIETLMRAEKVNPKDEIILSNIAHGYFLKGDTNNSKMYYKKILNSDDPKMVEFAKQRLEGLK